MKKIFFGISAIFVFCLCSCNNGSFTPPTAVEIKTNANYNFDILNIDKSFNEIFSAEKLFPQEENSSIKVYNYNPNGKSKEYQLLIYAPIQQIPLDFSDYLDSINLNDSLSSMSIDKSFKIPDVNFSNEKDLDLTEISDLINKIMIFSGESFSDGPVVFASENPANTFESIEYSFGGIGIVSAQPDDSTVSITSKDGKTIDGTFKNGSAVLTFTDGFVFSKTGMKISFSGETDVNYVGKISDDSKIEKVTGLTLSDSIEISLENKFEISSMETLRSCVIKKGTLTTNVDFSDSWSGQNLTFENVNISGGLNIPNISDGETSLDGKEFKPEDLNIDGNIKVSFENANLDFANVPKVVVGCKIDSLESATVVLDEDYNATVSKNQKLPEEATKILKEIVWMKSGVKISSTSTLPEGNDIKFSTIESNFFDIQETGKTLTTENPLEIYCKSELETSISTDSEVDFAVSLELPGYNEAEKTVTVKNIKPNEEYKIAITIEPTFDWLKVVVSPNGFGGASQSDKISTGFSMSSLFDELDTQLKLTEENSFKKNVEIKSIPTYLFCNLPSVLDSTKFEGTIKAFIGDSDGNPITTDGETYILGSETEKGELKSSTEPEFNINDDKEVTTDLEAVNATTSTNFAALINASKNCLAESSICLEYDLALSSESSDLTIGNPNHKDELSGEKVLDLSENNNISITAMIVVPFKLDIKNDLNINFMDFIKSDDSSTEENKDILNRTEATDLSNIEKYLDVIETVSVSYAPTKLPFGSDNKINLFIKIPSIDYDKELSLSKGTLELNPKEILETYPLEPEISATIPKGNFWIEKDVSLATHIILGIKTDGSLKFEF